MNQVINNIQIKHFNFINIDDVNKYSYMTRTSQAIYLAEEIQNYIKIIDKHNVYYFNINLKLWVLISDHEYSNFIIDFFNESSKVIKRLKQEANDIPDVQIKELKTLCTLFDNMTYIEDIIKRSHSRLFDKDFMTNLDRKPEMFPIKDGKQLNLKTLEITDRTIHDYFSYESSVEFLTGLTPHADLFFEQVMTNAENREYLRKVLGYTLTGETSARSFFIWFGKGSNAKSFVARLLELILKKQYHQCDQSIFIKTVKGTKGQATPELMALLGKRCSIYSEGETSDQIEMNSAGLKQISGEDSLCGRELYGNQITFTPYTKLHMLTNFRPPLNAEFAIKERLRYIFLDSEFVDNPDPNNNRQYKKDKQFTDDLETIYLSEIFTWIAKGAFEFYKTMTIEMTEDFKNRTDKMLNSEDSIKTFLERKLIITKNNADIIKKNTLFEAYKSFCNNNSQRCQPRSNLFNRLEHLGLNTIILHGYDVYRCLKLVSLDSEFDVGIFDDDDEQEFDYKLLYSNLRKETEDLKKQNEELKMKLKSLEPAKIVAKTKTAKK